METTPDDLVPVSRAATILRVCPSTVHRWRLSGKLRAWRRAGTRYLVSLGEVEALLQPVSREATRPVSGRVQRSRAAWDDEVLKAAGVVT